MPVTKCRSCGHISNYEKSGSCPRCGGYVGVRAPGQSTGGRKVAAVVILALLVLGGGAFAAVKLLPLLNENRKLEAEKKQLESFDYVTFNADADSVSKAVGAMPPKFSAPPPDLETMKQTVGEYYSKKVEKKKEFQTSLPSSGWRMEGNVVKVTAYSLKQIEPLQYDYVKGRDGKLVCFVNYRALVDVLDRKDEMIEYTNKEAQWQPIRQKAKKPLDQPLSETTLTEAARFEFEDGRWKFISAGLSELNRKLEIDKVRLEAKNLPAK